MPRPVRNFPWDRIEQFFRVQCEMEEVLDILAADYRTLNKACYRTYKISLAVYAAQQRAVGKFAIRQALYSTALISSKEGSSMARYLDKKYLGGLPSSQIPTPPPAAISASGNVIIQNNNNAALAPTKADVVGLLAQILGKPTPVRELPEVPQFIKEVKVAE